MTRRPRARKQMIMDACVLIDFIKADRVVLELVVKHVGSLHVVSPVVDEVHEDIVHGPLERPWVGGLATGQKRSHGALEREAVNEAQRLLGLSHEPQVRRRPLCSRAFQELEEPASAVGLHVSLPGVGVLSLGRPKQVAERHAPLDAELVAIEVERVAHGSRFSNAPGQRRDGNLAPVNGHVYEKVPDLAIG